MKLTFNISHVFLLVCLGCSNAKPELANPNKERFPTIVNVDNDLSNYDIIQNVNFIDFVKLETKSESLLGEIEKLVVADSDWYILSNNKITVFHSDGKFKHEFGKEGSGPGEYLEVTDFWFDLKNKTISILDVKSARISDYTLDGQFIHEEKLYSYPTYFAKWNSNYIFFQNKSTFYNNEKSSEDVLLVNNGEIVNKFFPFEKEFQKWYKPSEVFFLNKSNELFYFDFWKNDIHKLVDEQFEPHLAIDFGDYQLPIKYTVGPEEYDSQKKNFRHIYSRLLESENILYFDIYDRGNLVDAFYFKNKDMLFVLDKSKKHQENLLVKPIAVLNDDTFIAVANPDFLLSLREKDLLKDKLLNALTDKLDYYDNPVLLIFSI